MEELGGRGDFQRDGILLHAKRVEKEKHTLHGEASTYSLDYNTTICSDHSSHRGIRGSLVFELKQKSHHCGIHQSCDSVAVSYERAVFGALVSSSSDPTAESDTGERREEGREPSVKEQSRAVQVEEGLSRAQLNQ
ncbi:hypothetical protein EYF80_051767 [Liparis tanakae]|uniref:Uncharacterized protein n=1 Tax=Liparis tanakae TaxID=230148 RepID=A0A4Z2FA51_9TELE|nr:hypothetical protein EYF80_051767 [Liparis tanakae]